MTAATAIDRADAERTGLLTGYGLAFAVWAGALAMTMVLIVGPDVGGAPTPLPVPPRSVTLGLVGAQIVGFAVWTAFLVRLMLLGRRVARDPVLRAAARDERSRGNQRDAVFVAFWVVILATGLTIPLEVSLGVTLTASTFASVAIWLGVTTALLAYVWMERRDAA